ncbi:MAG: shikimate kinase [Gammaproteobacteria bacterium]|nr:shikimate kinase [Gammaproteobacteria bacterium]|tara:strand:+ start:2246 stop:2743 length:498 start_codon:yes stop_codon:yes gene_type:complete
MNSICFIGMAGCGKSTIGKAISTKLDVNFIDTDLLIEKKYEASLEEIKNIYDYKFVRDAEEEVILNLNSSNKIIATGGSAVYSTKSMEHLKTFSSIIYIKTSLEIIIKRIDVGQERGLAVPAGMSIPDIYSEREPMYQKYHDFILDGSKTIEQLVVEVEKIYLNR